MTPEGVAELLLHLPGWKAEVSPQAVGRGRYAELYAVLYRAELVSVEQSFRVDDEEDVFEREPFVTCLRAQAFDFCLVVIHVIFGREARARDLEILALGELVSELRDAGPEKDWIVLGDFNRKPGAPGWDALLTAGWDFTAKDALATSLGKNQYRNPYDHILVDARFTSEIAGPARRVDFVERACGGDFDVCRVEVSDHAPVVVRFRTSGPDDD